MMRRRGEEEGEGARNSSYQDNSLVSLPLPNPPVRLLSHLGMNDLIHWKILQTPHWHCGKDLCGIKLVFVFIHKCSLSHNISFIHYAHACKQDRIITN